MPLTRTISPLLGLAALAALGLTAAPPAQAQTNLLMNGSFENGTFTDNGSKADSLSVGSTAMTGWTTTNAEMAWLENGNPYGLATPFGSFFLDLTGYHDSAPYAGVTQTIATVSGAQYALTFDIGADQSNGAYSGPMSVTAGAGSATQTFTFTPPLPTGNQWGAFTLDFTGTGTPMAITLTGASTAGGQYLGLDNVSVSVTAAPEPSSIAALGLGVLGLAALGLRARKRLPRSGA